MRLEPLNPDHAAALYAAARTLDGQTWRFLPFDLSRSEDILQEWLTASIDALGRKAELPFAIIERATGRVIGSTRIYVIGAPDRSYEIGWTWLAKDVQRTGINTECKYLLLRHLFESLDAIRVQLKADSRNTPSRNAILRIGAIYEGTLRKQRINHDGYIRDAAYYSIIAEEWPTIKTNLEMKMEVAR